MCARLTVLSDTPIASAIAGCVIPISRHSTIWMRSRCAGGNFQCRAVFSRRTSALLHLIICPQIRWSAANHAGQEKNTAPTTLTPLVHKNLDSSGYGGGMSGVPNLIAPTPDGRRLYVGIALAWDDMSAFPEIRAAASGGIDVIDTVSLQNVKSIPIRGGIHDLYVTPDGKYVVAGAVRAAKPPTNLMSVIDTRTNEIAWTFAMSPAPSPMAITANPDGSTNKIYAQNTRHGFAVIDFATHLQTNFIDLPSIPAAQQNRFGGASHGIAVTADQKTLLVNSSRNSALYAYSLPDLTLLGGAALGGKGANWLTISPDDKTAYVANPQTNDVSVVDIKSLKEVARVPVGFAPSRNTAWVAP